MQKELYELGEVPVLGVVPKKMHAQVIRTERFGEPRDAFQAEVVDVPQIGPQEVLVCVMAAGVNYNNIWAGRGVPVNVIAARQKAGAQEDFHIGGTDATGVVWQVGSDVKTVRVGDEVILVGVQWDPNDPHILAGKDPALAPSQRVWGYETNWGAFAQFCTVQARQCQPKPVRLSWEEAAAYGVSGFAAYRMLHNWKEHEVEKDDVVLVWGGSGGVGSMAIQLCRVVGAKPVAVVSDSKKIEYCKKMGAVGVLDRTLFHHWGLLPDWRDTIKYQAWLKEARRFGQAIWEAVGERKSPRIVVEHPGEETLPTSLFVCDAGGMVVTCAGTTGYNVSFDLRYHWMRQKRFQGSHACNDNEARDFNELINQGKVDPCLSKTWQFHETGEAHQLMRENNHPLGNMSILVNARKVGMKTLM